MDPRGPGPGAGAGGEGGGRGRAQMLRNLSLRRPGQTDGDTDSSASGAGRGALLRGISADSTVGGTSVTTTETPPAVPVPAGRGALLRNLPGGPSQSSSSVSSSATSRQEILAKLQQKRQQTTATAESVAPKPIGRAGLVSSFEHFLVS